MSNKRAYKPDNTHNQYAHESLKRQRLKKKEVRVPCARLDSIQLSRLQRLFIIRQPLHTYNFFSSFNEDFSNNCKGRGKQILWMGWPSRGGREGARNRWKPEVLQCRCRQLLVKVSPHSSAPFLLIPFIPAASIFPLSAFNRNSVLFG